MHRKHKINLTRIKTGGGDLYFVGVLFGGRKVGKNDTIYRRVGGKKKEVLTIQNQESGRIQIDITSHLLNKSNYLRKLN